MPAARLQPKRGAVYVCACGESVKDDYTDALGHNWGERETGETRARCGLRNTSYSTDGGLTKKHFRGSFTMPDANVTVYAEFDDGWSRLQAMLATMTSTPNKITQTKPYTAYADSGPPVIPAGAEVVLYLNHWNINRNLANAEAEEDGCVIVNNGTLTIRNSGTGAESNITGGSGGIYNAGTLDVIQRRLIKWAMCKYKRFRGHRIRAEEWLIEVKMREPKMFAH